MKKIRFIALVSIVLLFALTMVYASDLPIDINAIGRQDNTNTRITMRFSTHLFTADSQRANDALAEQINRRQQTANDLFQVVPVGDTVDIYAQIAYKASSLGLFSTPATFNHINMPAPEEPLSIWIIVVVLAACALGGFIWAFTVKSKKAVGSEDDVY
jgi:flagellar basal body-associated protein FliL